MNKPTRRRTALVTGASAGIGAAYARKLAAEGYDVAVVARRKDRLIALQLELKSRHAISVYPVQADLADPDSPRQIIAELSRQNLDIAYLVNNAGYGQVGLYCDIDWQTRLAYLQTLGISALELTHRVLPSMLENRYGRIVNITSIMAYTSGLPNQTLYNPIKAMMLRFSETIAGEYGDQGVRCLAAAPGLTDTELFEVSGMSQHMKPSRLLRYLMASPESFVEAAYRACEAGKRQFVHRPVNKVWAFLASHSPAFIRYRLALAATGYKNSP